MSHCYILDSGHWLAAQNMIELEEDGQKVPFSSCFQFVMPIPPFSSMISLSNGF
jgi:hypothetical protein